MTSVCAGFAGGARLEPRRSSAAAFLPVAVTPKSQRRVCQVVCAAQGGVPEQLPLELVPAPNTPPPSSTWGPGNGLVMGAVVGFQVGGFFYLFSAAAAAAAAAAAGTRRRLPQLF